MFFIPCHKTLSFYYCLQENIFFQLNRTYYIVCNVLPNERKTDCLLLSSELLSASKSNNQTTVNWTQLINGHSGSEKVALLLRGKVNISQLQGEIEFNTFLCDKPYN